MFGNVRGVGFMNNKAFTLVELSIVLIIISLIVGGVIGGQSLVRSAKLNKLISEITSYETSFNNFELQYDAMPGDFREASQYWPTYAEPGGGAVDGDGDGQIESRTNEYKLSSYHLHLADLIHPVYDPTGIFVTSKYGNNTVITINTSIIILGAGLLGLDNGSIDGKTSLNISYFDSATALGNKAILSPVDMISIDKKMDDGLPRAGKLVVLGILSSGPFSPSCIAVGDKYNLSTSEKICNISYVLR